MASLGEALVLEAALERLGNTEPPVFLSRSPELAQIARTASAGLYSLLVSKCPRPSLDRLLVDDCFDAEQIWHQIDLLSRPLVLSLGRDLKRLQRQPPPSVFLPAPKPGDNEDHNDSDNNDDDGALGEQDDDFGVEDEDQEEEDDGMDIGEVGEEEEEEEEEDEKEEMNSGVEDRFLKIKELEEYLEKDEAREHGIPEKKGKNLAAKRRDEDEEEEEEDEEDEEEEDGEGGFDFGDYDAGGGDESDGAEDARYDDFFVSSKKKGSKREDGSTKKRRPSLDFEAEDKLEDMDMNDEEKEDDDDDHDTNDGKLLSTHERQHQKIQAKIKQMEKENLEAKSWTMQGEVTAAKRPKNSALEVNLDFEHKVRPPPVITDEVTASLEDLIRKRIIESHYDDVQRAPALPFKAPKERKELDENKSQKGLAEIYEEEYAQKAGLVSAPLSSSEEQKKEASILFKSLCLKLDALSHFHFAPKPVIEDMSVQNVPALAMEEIAPLAVSDAAMLAPEEIFEGKGDIKDEAEVTKADRKRRRANKKRKFKVETAKRAAKKARET